MAIRRLWRFANQVSVNAVRDDIPIKIVQGT